MSFSSASRALAPVMRPRYGCRMPTSDLSLDFLRVVERAAIACARTMGRGDREAADRAAVEAMRHELDTAPICRRVSQWP